MPKTMIVGNWKMNTTLTEAAALASGVREKSLSVSGAEVVLCPPSLSLAAVKDALAGSSVKVGAQNMHSEPSGAFTGEIAPTMLRGLCEYVILGHSERRQLFGETDELINRKTLAAFQYHLQPILCVGESLEQREQRAAPEVIARQVGSALTNAGELDITSLVVAYEPIWAIGSGQAATPEIAAEMMDVILETLRSKFGAPAEDVPLLYGGSVNAGNIADFATQPNIHGALVGGASLQAESFIEIARLAAETKADPLEPGA